MKVAHLTSAHPRYDVRIFLKECCSLASAGYNVHLVVADGKGDEVQNGVEFHDVGLQAGRFKRMLMTPRKVLKKALAIDADLYHLHDPELLPIGYKLKKAGKKVVFDSHEDVPTQILGKPYLNKFSKFFISKIFSLYESWVCARLDAIVAATPFIQNKFSSINQRSVAVNNFPLLDELSLIDVKWSEKQDQVCYVGSIGRVRGVAEIVDAIQYVTGDTTLALAGDLKHDSLGQALMNSPGWQRTQALGFLDRAGVKLTLAQSRAGLVTLHPIPNYLDALPVKMFEYMAAGIPVITSDFPLWRNIVEQCHCGICVDPLNPKEIASAIEHIIMHPQAAEKMGRNGRRAVQEKYNWTIEKRSLLSLYAGLE